MEINENPPREAFANWKLSLPAHEKIKLLDRLKDEQSKTISLYVLDTNEVAKKFYEKNNFSLVSIIKKYYITLNADGCLYEYIK